MRHAESKVQCPESKVESREVCEESEGAIDGALISQLIRSSILPCSSVA